MSFSARLKQIIEERKLSQSEVARMCGIKQPSLNYILNNDLQSSKLAPQIANSLDINPEWLLYGEGRPEILLTYDLPILHSPSMLKKHLKGYLDSSNLEFTTIDKFLGDQSFAYLYTTKKMAICCKEYLGLEIKEFLSVIEDKVEISNSPYDLSFLIFEWRIRNEDF